ncbi:hypothetical protein OESDEN_03450 [Oesophagostomum dentatum]|uniref:Uncharacterized protein n=1 Tax=Oesophagostomum dentatum TaxID=61180 RepID=A0A0B1TH61_OESDE|nr:hypothetical protein OESDEN_03450 [Oesophagostomum dentatum]
MLRKHSPAKKHEKRKESPAREEEKPVKSSSGEDRGTSRTTENERPKKEKRQTVVKKDSRDLRRGNDKAIKKGSPAAEHATHGKLKNETLRREMSDEERNFEDVPTVSGKSIKKDYVHEDRSHNTKTSEKTSKKENAKIVEEKTTKERKRGSAGKGRAVEKIEICLPLEERKLLEEAKRVEEKMLMQDDWSETTEDWLKQDSSALEEEKPARRETYIRRKSRDEGVQTSDTGSPIEAPTLEAHIGAIRERRMSLPRTISIDPAADVEILIGEVACQ